MSRSYVVGAVLAWFSLASLAVGGFAAFTPEPTTELDPSHGHQTGQLAAVAHGGIPEIAVVIDIPARAASWTALIEQYFLERDVDRALAVLHCESSGDPQVSHPGSGAAGLFQHLPQFWDERTEAAGQAEADIFDPEANIAVASWLVYKGGGWKHWYPSASCWTAIIEVEQGG